jgi:hypothetical protein
LNSRLSDWIFRRISKPFESNFRSANKQFIAPLPVPDADPQQEAQVARLARELQTFTTRRRDRAQALGRRVESVAARLRPDTWLWADLGTLDDWLARQPADLDTREREREAKAARQADIDLRHADIKERLMPGAEAEAALRDGELLFSVGREVIVERVFVDPDEADLVLAQWRRVARNLAVTESTRPKSITDALRMLVLDVHGAAARQIVAFDREIVALDEEISRLEDEMEDLLAGLYGLTAEERALVAAR